MILASELFKKNIRFVQYGRSGSVLVTSQKSTAEFLKLNGWKLYISNGLYRLNSPNINLVDISDINKINQYNNPIFNYALYRFLQRKIAKNAFKDYVDMVINKHKIIFKNFVYHVSCGPILNFAIKIEGSDCRIYKLKPLIIDNVINDDEFNEMYDKLLAVKPENFLVRKQQLSVANFNKYNELCQKFGHDIKLKQNSCEFTIDYGNFSFDNYDYVLLILKGCFKFIHFFDISSFADKIIFWEIHIDKSKGEDKVDKIELLKNKRIIVVDSVYSGTTIKYVKKILQPISSNIEVLGIFPKSESVFDLCNYVLLGNKVFDCKYLKNYSFIDDYLYLLGGKDGKKRYTS